MSKSGKWHGQFYINKKLRGKAKPPPPKLNPEAERTFLLRNIALLKKAGNFRDIVLGSKMWFDVRKVLTDAQKKAMDAWVYGPLMYVGQLRPKEEAILKDMQKELVHCPTRLEDLDFLQLNMLLFDCEGKYSWLYVQDLPLDVVNGCNAMLSHFKRKLRVKAELKTDKGNKFPAADTLYSIPKDYHIRKV